MCEQYKSQDFNSDEHQTSMWQASCLLGRVWSGGAHLKHRENFQPAPLSSKCFVFLLLSVFSPQIPYMHKITDSHAGHWFQWICCLEAIQNVSPFLHNPKASSVSSVTLHVDSWPPSVALNLAISFISSLNLPVVKSFLAKCWKPHTSLLWLPSPKPVKSPRYSKEWHTLYGRSKHEHCPLKILSASPKYLFSGNTEIYRCYQFSLFSSCSLGFTHWEASVKSS